ncbi:hypothetical protein ABPG75_002596 [Micractinium tetrahymenae]
MAACQSLALPAAARPVAQPRSSSWRPSRRPHPVVAASSGRGGQAAPPPPPGLVAAGPATPPPDYSAIDAQPLNRAVYGLFRRRMVQAIGSDSQLEGYGAIIDLTRRLNAMHASPAGTQEATVGILRSLFPPWLPGAFAVMFSRPMPGLSCQLNAWATWLTCQWLMGECEVNDVEIDGGQIGKGHGVLVKRCRYLEESGCASICINSCKVPTQALFQRHMGLPLEMKPNYEDFSCQFSFGKTPPPESEDAAFATPCFQQCPTARRTGGGAAAAAGAAAAERCHKIALDS